MNHLDWEFFEAEFASQDYAMTDFGPLYGPVSGFSIVRDKSLQLMLETTSANNSVSQDVPRPAGSVYIATAEIQLRNKAGSFAIATGIIPHSRTKTFATDSSGSTTEISSIHCLKWESEATGDPTYLIEWIGNLDGNFIWPHSDEISDTPERRRRLYSPDGEIDLGRAGESLGGSRSCAHLVIDGIELFIGESRVKVPYVVNPGFILYKGAPDKDIRSKIRECLSFCLGNFLLYLGDTTFDQHWYPLAFTAVSGHALIEEAPRLNGWQPAPLGPQWEHEINSKWLSSMASALYSIYDSYRLRTIFWSYWHAVAAPVHMSAAHFGSAIEGIQKAYFKAKASSAVHSKIVSDERIWKELRSKISACIAATDLTDEEKRILTNKASNLNFAPQSIIMERFFAALGLQIGPLERDVWANRNHAAHGGGADEDNGGRLVRENKVLKVMLHRILLALAQAGDFYYDYYTLGRPTRKLASFIVDDRVE